MRILIAPAEIAGYYPALNRGFKERFAVAEVGEQHSARFKKMRSGFSDVG
jgi:hypothetical protein